MDIPQVEKQQFRNESGGFIGVVKIDAKGEEKGAAVEPGGTVWLTLNEQVATANAPRQAKDNPFLPTTFTRVNPDTSEIEEYEVTPLVPISESRYVPAGDRPVPGFQSQVTPPPVPVTPTGQGAVAPPPSEPDPAPPTVKEMQAPQPPTRAAAAAAEAAAAATQAAEEAQTTEEAPVQEETAQDAAERVEETGAAAQPTGEAVVGEFAAHEEVGTPTPGVVGQPAPWSPGSEAAEDAEAAGRTPSPDPSGE
jgi:hypothetical protein